MFAVAGKYFGKIANPNQMWIVITISRLISHKMEFRFVLVQSWHTIYSMPWFNRESVITVHIWFGFTRFRKYFCVLHFHNDQMLGLLGIMWELKCFPWNPPYMLKGPKISSPWCLNRQHLSRLMPKIATAPVFCRNLCGFLVWDTTHNATFRATVCSNPWREPIRKPIHWTWHPVASREWLLQHEKMRSELWF